jgi:hypothetical protein
VCFDLHVDCMDGGSPTPEHWVGRLELE